MTWLQSLDVYPKIDDEIRRSYTRQTISGALVSIGAIILMIALFVSELNFFLTTDVKEELFVDTSRNAKVRINVDIFFPEMPCSYLSLDVMDVSGEQHRDVEHDIFKKRVHHDGTEIEKIQMDGLGDNDNSTVNSALAKLDQNRCESCYGAEDKPGNCCNTCEDVKEAYRKKGWAFNGGRGIAQCEREGIKDALIEQVDEGCIVTGFLHVNKVAGNFHFAPGKSFQQHNVHVHDLQPFAGKKAFNMSHYIRKLSFGPDYPGKINPLDGGGETSNEEGFSMMYQYFVKVVPTKYRNLNSQVAETAQFSVTMHTRKLAKAVGTQGLPGVFFMYEFSPILVELTEHQRSFMHFLTSICAILGGVYTVAGLLDKFIYTGQQRWIKANEGKQG